IRNDLDVHVASLLRREGRRLIVCKGVKALRGLATSGLIGDLLTRCSLSPLACWRTAFIMAVLTIRRKGAKRSRCRGVDGRVCSVARHSGLAWSIRADGSTMVHGIIRCRLIIPFP